LLNLECRFPLAGRHTATARTAAARHHTDLEGETHLNTVYGFVPRSASLLCHKPGLS